MVFKANTAVDDYFHASRNEWEPSEMAVIKQTRKA